MGGVPAKKFKWTEEQIVALVGSIAKWRKILDEGAEDRGTKSCTLCKRFFGKVTPSCRNCPVCRITGYAHCDNTPYADWTDHMHNEHDASFMVECDKCRDLAQAELDFLNEVLEAGL